MEKQKYKEIDLTDDEKLFAQLNLDKLTINVATGEFDITQMKKEIELRLPLREAEIVVRTKEEELKAATLQKKMYQLRVRTGKKKVPIIQNDTK